MALAEQTGLSAVVTDKVAFTAAEVASAGSNPAGKLAAIIAGMAAGADSIDDLDIIRSGGKEGFDRIKHARCRSPERFDDCEITMPGLTRWSTPRVGTGRQLSWCSPVGHSQPMPSKPALRSAAATCAV